MLPAVNKQIQLEAQAKSHIYMDVKSTLKGKFTFYLETAWKQFSPVHVYINFELGFLFFFG